MGSLLILLIKLMTDQSPIAVPQPLNPELIDKELRAYVNLLTAIILLREPKSYAIQIGAAAISKVNNPAVFISLKIFGRVLLSIIQS